MEKGVRVEEFFKFSPKELYNGLKTGHNVIFEDGVISMSPHEIIFNRYIWEIFAQLHTTSSYKKYGGMTMFKRYSVTEYYFNNFFADKSLSSVLECIFKDICLRYVEPYMDRTILDEYLFRKIEEVYNEIYNHIVCGGVEYQSSVDIVDFHEIQFQPKLMEAMKKVGRERSPSSIKHAYEVLDDVIRNTPEVRDNPIVRGYLSGAYNKNQVRQTLGPRGYTTEINSDIIPTPVLSSFFLGMESISSMGIESRNAAKAQFVATKAIQRSEYLARSLQIANMRVQRLVDGDCGTTEYTTWYVNDEEDGKDDLPLLAGSWYLDEETGTEKILEKSDVHLRGKYIKLRLPNNCKHPNPEAICLKCMGRIGYSIPYCTNLGHAISVEITQKITQGLLSIKHVMDSAVGIQFELEPSTAQFFIKTDKNSLKMRFKPAKNTKYELVIKQSSVYGIKGLSSDMNFDAMNPSKLSRLSEFCIQVTDLKTGAIEYVDCDVSFSKSAMKKEKTKKRTKSSIVHGFFTLDFVKYILSETNGERNYTLSDDGQDYIINLDGWIGRRDDIIAFPSLEYNFFQLVTELESIVKKEEIDNIDRFMQDMYDLLNVKLDIPLVLISVLTSAFIVRSKNGSDMRLARGVAKDVVTLAKIIFSSSLSTIAAYERHQTNFMLPQTFNNHNIGSHPLDVALMPQDVIEEYREGLR